MVLASVDIVIAVLDGISAASATAAADIGVLDPTGIIHESAAAGATTREDLDQKTLVGVLGDTGAGLCPQHALLVRWMTSTDDE